MPVHSAAALLYRREPGDVVVFVAHMGGPFWQHKDAGAWTFPKGEFDPEEEPAVAAAAREFEEEIGVACPEGLQPLGEFTQPSGKIIHVFAVEAPSSVAFVRSNEFEMEWPRGSGRMRAFPEIDRASWVGIEQARALLVKGQRPILDALSARLGEPGAG